MKQESKTEIASAYLRNWRDNSEDSWAFTEVYGLIGSDPEYCWKVFLEMVDLTKSKAALCYIAAGPLEDLLSKYGMKFVERAKLQAEKDPKFLYALANVWLEEDDEAYPHIQNIIAAHKIQTLEDLESLLDDT